MLQANIMNCLQRKSNAGRKFLRYELQTEAPTLLNRCLHYLISSDKVPSLTYTLGRNAFLYKYIAWKRKEHKVLPRTAAVTKCNCERQKTPISEMPRSAA